MSFDQSQNLQTLGQLLKQVDGARVLGDDCIPIADVSEDTRKLGAGSLFAAIKGTYQDGNRYIEQALAAGAVAVLTDDPVRASRIPAAVGLVPDARLAYAQVCAAYFGHPSNRLKVIGVTGTNGKTTVTHLLASIIKAAGLRAGVQGTLGQYQLDGSVNPSLSTPSCRATQEYAAALVAGGCEFFVLEATSHGIEQKRIAGLDFDAVSFSNCTQDHLDYHGSMELYFAVKRSLFSQYLAHSAKAGKVGVVNIDDPWGRKLLDQVKQVPLVTFGFQPELNPDCLATVLSINPVRLSLSFRGERFEVSSSLHGRFNAENIAHAAALALACNLSVHAVVEGIAAVERVPGRLERVGGRRDPLIFVDFAHTPDGLSKVLSSCIPEKGRLFCVFGCGGDRDRGKRPQMGEIAATYCDHLVVTSDNPRSELPMAIIEDIVKGIPGRFSRLPLSALTTATPSFAVEQDRRAAIRGVLPMLGSQDVLVVAGKGHEQHIEAQGKKEPYNDRVYIEGLLAARSETTPCM